jgi:hypothetical protein
LTLSKEPKRFGADFEKWAVNIVKSEEAYKREKRQIDR